MKKLVRYNGLVYKIMYNTKAYIDRDKGRCGKVEEANQEDIALIKALRDGMNSASPMVVCEYCGKEYVGLCTCKSVQEPFGSFAKLNSRFKSK